MSRTDDIRKGTHGKERGGMVGGTPFVKWGDHYTWLEGTVQGTFQTKYGLAATMKVNAMHDDGLLAAGKNDEGEDYTDIVAAGSTVNVGMASAALQGKVTEDDVGKSFHIAFEGWEEPKGGNRYRVFAVIELTEREPAQSAPDEKAPWERDDDNQRPEIEPDF